MSLPIRKADKLVVAALKGKGAVPPKVIIDIMGSDYVSKMLWWLKKHKYEFNLVKDKGKLISVEMVKEGKLPDAKVKVEAPKEPAVKKTKAKKRASNPFNRMPTKAPTVKASGATPFVPMDDESIKRGNFAVDEDFDNASMDDILYALKGVDIEA